MIPPNHQLFCPHSFFYLYVPLHSVTLEILSSAETFSSMEESNTTEQSFTISTHSKKLNLNSSTRIKAYLNTSSNDHVLLFKHKDKVTAIIYLLLTSLTRVIICINSVLGKNLIGNLKYANSSTFFSSPKKYLSDCMHFSNKCSSLVNVGN